MDVYQNLISGDKRYNKRKTIGSRGLNVYWNDELLFTVLIIPRIHNGIDYISFVICFPVNHCRVEETLIMFVKVGLYATRNKESFVSIPTSLICHMAGRINNIPHPNHII